MIGAWLKTPTNGADVNKPRIVNDGHGRRTRVYKRHHTHTHSHTCKRIRLVVGRISITNNLIVPFNHSFKSEMVVFLFHCVVVNNIENNRWYIPYNIQWKLSSFCIFPLGCMHLISFCFELKTNPTADHDRDVMTNNNKCPHTVANSISKSYETFDIFQMWSQLVSSWVVVIVNFIEVLLLCTSLIIGDAVVIINGPIAYMIRLVSG